MKNILDEVFSQVDGHGDALIKKKLMEMLKKKQPTAMSVEVSSEKVPGAEVDVESGPMEMSDDDKQKLMELYAKYC